MHSGSEVGKEGRKPSKCSLCNRTSCFFLPDLYVYCFVGQRKKSFSPTIVESYRVLEVETKKDKTAKTARNELQRIPRSQIDLEMVFIQYSVGRTLPHFFPYHCIFIPFAYTPKLYALYMVIQLICMCFSKLRYISKFQRV